jgi:hypothetical protein
MTVGRIVTSLPSAMTVSSEAYSALGDDFGRRAESKGTFWSVVQ